MTCNDMVMKVISYFVLVYPHFIPLGAIRYIDTSNRLARLAPSATDEAISDFLETSLPSRQYQGISN